MYSSYVVKQTLDPDFPWGVFEELKRMGHANDALLGKFKEKGYAEKAANFFSNEDRY